MPGGKVEGIETLGDPTSEELTGANTTQAVVDHSAAENVVTLYVAPSQDGTVQTGKAFNTTFFRLVFVLIALATSDSEH